MQARWRKSVNRQTEPLHTLNGSGVAAGRSLVAVARKLSAGRWQRSRADVLRSVYGRLRRDSSEILNTNKKGAVFARSAL